MMRRALLLTASLAVLALAGCPKKFQNGECENSDNCKAQEGYGKVCVQGRCQECGGDTDCKAGFVCRGNKCEPRPECEGPADCASGKTCQAGKCVAAAPSECGPDKACPGGQECMDGRCVAKAAPPPAGGPCDPLASVNFGFDESTLTAEARAKLEQDARCLKDGGAQGVTVEGNCDERGTAEYNVHLGQRRADAVKKYLGGLGIAAKTISTVSYGKEKPICTEATEACWARNRRADLKAK
jgi:peptidoglycan-associated lipoprotein